MVRARGHFPVSQIARSTHQGRMASTAHVTLSVALKSQDEAGLQDFVSHVANPQDPLYGKYLTTDQFTERFAPTQQDYDQTVQYFTSKGLSVTPGSSAKNSGRMIINLEGSVSDVENAFQVELHQYLTPEGALVYGPTDDPLVSDTIAAKVNGIHGLNTFPSRHPHFRASKIDHTKLRANANGPGTGIQGSIIPTDIRKAYGTSNLAQTGTGQTLALFELDAYRATDPAAYASNFGIANPPPLSVVPVDGGVATPGSGEVEVDLDIEMMFAMAPGATKILVYEGPNTDQGDIDTYNMIASQNLAKIVSTSWGGTDTMQTAAIISSENTAFMQMASQGQSMFAAAGDDGAYDNGTLGDLGTDDPASQPYVTGVGGTTISLSNSAYVSESSWGTPGSSGNFSGGGGGISGLQTIPTYQKGVSTSTNMGSTTMRMVPDVSLNANPTTGYFVVTSGGEEELVGGTSAAAPLWAAFMALVNEGRAAAGAATIGFANPALYQLGQSSKYGAVFHDINDGSNNLHYVAVTGYDLSTGWGSINATGLYPALVNPVLPPYAPAALTVTPRNTGTTVVWSIAPGATSYSLMRATSAAGPFTAIATGLTTTSYQSFGLSNGTTYYYEVNAINASGTSGASLVGSGTPALVPPQAPTSLTVTEVAQ